MSRRLKVGDKVWVELTEQHEDLLLDMALTDSEGEILRDVRMHGTIRSVSRKNKSVHFKIHLPAAEEEIQFSCAKTNKVVDETASNYFVVAPDESGTNVIKKVSDLVLPKQVEGYHSTMRAARHELRGLGKTSNVAVAVNVCTPRSGIPTVSSDATATVATSVVSTSAAKETTTVDAVSACHTSANDTATQVINN